MAKATIATDTLFRRGPVKHWGLFSRARVDNSVKGRRFKKGSEVVQTDKREYINDIPWRLPVCSFVLIEVSQQTACNPHTARHAGIQ